MAGVPLALNFVGDSLEAVGIPLQGPIISYQMKGSTIESSAQGQALPPATAVVRRDTLTFNQGGDTTRFLRIGASKPDSAGVLGSWRALRPWAFVLTLRSDSMLFAEQGFATNPNFRGDTIDVEISRGKPGRFLFRKSGDTLLLKAVDTGSQRVLLRRPWGCFGIASIDRSAVECR